MPDSDPSRPISTDDEYERDRTLIEQHYQLLHIGWHEDVLEEARKLPDPPDAWAVLEKTASAAWTGKEAEPEPKRLISVEAILRLMDICGAFAKANLNAYAACLQRLKVPPSQIVTSLESYVEIVLSELCRRKWNPSIAAIAELFDVEQWVSKQWAEGVEKEAREHVHNLESQIWLQPVPSEEDHAGNSAEAEQPTVGEQINHLRLECRWTHEELADATGFDPRTITRHISGKAQPSLKKLGGYEIAFSKRLNQQVVIRNMPVKRP